MRHLNKVKTFSLLGGYRIRVTFRDGFTGKVDMWPAFEHPVGPMDEPFRDPEFFQQAFVDPELEVVTWPNGYDICSDLLRYYCELGRVCSDEEMNAHFCPQPETSALILHDQPNP